MTAADWIDNLERKAKAATPGPWYAWDRGVGWLIALDPDGDVRLPEGMRTDLGRREDAEFIAAANPTTILRLIRELQVAERKARGFAYDLRITEAMSDQRAARLAAVEALAKGWAAMAAQAADDDTREWLAAASRSVLAALAAPTDTTKETDR